MLIAPTEPPLLKKLGSISSTPERYGADYLMFSPTLGTVGVQRKEIKDLIASTYDGRLDKEFAQMKGLGQGVLLIEGKVSWQTDGLVVGNYSRYTMSQHLGMIWNAQLNGYWVGSTASLTETSEYLSRLTKWIAKSEHRDIGNGKRVNPQGTWGKADNRDWGIHLLQSFEGVGAKVAADIYDWFGGVPMEWTATEEELRDVPGIGKGRAKRMLEALREDG